MTSRVMKTFVFSAIVCTLLWICQAAEPQLPCAPCGSVQCGSLPQGCELDTIPCGCCPTCVRTLNQVCEAFAPRCGTGLLCLTPAGLVDDRPPWYKQYLKGVCVKDPFHSTSTSMTSVG